MRLIDLTGKRFGRLTVLHRAERNKGRHVVWTCKCDCGNVVNVLGCHLRSGATESCGCLHSETTSKNCLSVKAGDKYGRLTVVERATPIGEKPIKWKCLCECGNYAVVETSKLKSGSTKSCGCYKAEISKQISATHNMSSTRLYRVWCAIKRRCYLPTCREYRFYGALGVKMCDEWKNDFVTFHDWAINTGYDEDAPRGKCTIDRIDPYGNYEPSNCRWVDMNVQSHNKRSDHQPK